MSLYTQKQQCLAKIEEAFVTAERHYNVTLPRVPVVFSNKQTRTAGTATYRTDFLSGKIKGIEIKLAEKLLVMNGDAFVERTPGHEAAHIIAVQVYGTDGKGHGQRWKEVMRVIGQPADVYHSFETPAQKNRVTAHCMCQTHEITKIRANKILNGTASYSCKSCRAPLRLQEQVKPEEIKKIRTVTLKPLVKKAEPKAVAQTSKSKVSNAQQVREYIAREFDSEQQALDAQSSIIDWAAQLFATRGAARSCVKANTPRAFNGYKA